MTANSATAASAADQPTPEHILQVGLAFWASKTLLSAIELEVFTELAKHPLPLDGVAGQIGLASPVGSRLFRCAGRYRISRARWGHATETPLQRICISTSGSRAMSEACSRCAIAVCTRSGPT